MALTDVNTTVVDADDLRGYFDSQPEKIELIISELGERLSRLTREYGEVCFTIENAYPKDSARKPGIAEKIKKFAASYKNALKNQRISHETYKTLVQNDHSYGYSKRVETYRKGDLIFREGEPGRYMYDIHSGSVNIYSCYGTPSEKLLITIGKDKFFGEIGLVSESPRTATVVVNEDSTVIESISMDDFIELYSKNPDKIEMIVKHLAGRVRSLTDQYVEACGVLYRVDQSDQGEIPEKEAKSGVDQFVTAVAGSGVDPYTIYCNRYLIK